MEAALWSQRCLAADRARRTLPALDLLDLRNQVGLEVAQLVEAHLDGAGWASVPDRIDDYLIAGDLKESRGLVVGADKPTARQIPSSLGRARRTETSAMSVDGFAALRALGRSDTLVLNQAEQRLGEAVLDLTEDLSTALRSSVQVNCYISMADATGFGAHWDDHDVIIIQLAGSKYWEIERPTELGANRQHTPKEGSGATVWSGVLTSGLALYIPRGWAHRVHSIDGPPSVHLTMSIARPSTIKALEVVPGSWLRTRAPVDRVLDVAHALWNIQVSGHPRTGPLEFAGARSEQYSERCLRLVAPGGLVFVSNRSDADRIVLGTPAGILEISRSNAPLVVHALTNQWWTVDDLVAVGGSRSETVEFVDALGDAQLLAVRRTSC